MRRIHLPHLQTGDLPADAAQSHHLRTVLRIEIGETIEVFDADGRTALAKVTAIEPRVVLRIDEVNQTPSLPTIIVASAVPKGDRADWLVEKLSEVGAARFIPLRTARSVVHPEGKGKTDRWHRIAVESAKQCRRPGLLQIDPLTDIRTLLPTIPKAMGFYCSTDPQSAPLISAFIVQRSSFLLIGPEGDWTPDEETAFKTAGLTPVSLGPTIMRVETAAVLAAGLAILLSSTRS